MKSKSTVRFLGNYSARVSSGENRGANSTGSMYCFMRMRTDACSNLNSSAGIPATFRARHGTPLTLQLCSTFRVAPDRGPPYQLGALRRQHRQPQVQAHTQYAEIQRLPTA